MSGISQFAWQICLACVVAAAARLLFPGGQMKPVINVILTLYIVTAVLPRGSESWNWSWPEQESVDPEIQEYQAYTQQLYFTAVEEELLHQLNVAGIGGRLRISDSGNCILETDASLWEQAVQVLREGGWQGGIIQGEYHQ